MFKFPKRDNEYQLGTIIHELLKIYDSVEVKDATDCYTIVCTTEGENEQLV